MSLHILADVLLSQIGPCNRTRHRSNCICIATQRDRILDGSSEDVARLEKWKLFLHQLITELHTEIFGMLSCALRKQ